MALKSVITNPDEKLSLNIFRGNFVVSYSIVIQSKGEIMKLRIINYSLMVRRAVRNFSRIIIIVPVKKFYNSGNSHFLPNYLGGNMQTYNMQTYNICDQR
jgi:hypothetical protein